MIPPDISAMSIRGTTDTDSRVGVSRHVGCHREQPWVTKAKYQKLIAIEVKVHVPSIHQNAPSLVSHETVCR